MAKKSKDEASGRSAEEDSAEGEEGGEEGRGETGAPAGQARA